MEKTRKYTALDLFCGCGGFSLGLEWAGFHELAAIDNNSNAIKVFKTNFPLHIHVLEKDLTKYQPIQLANIIGTNYLDLIVGGPPCQGFSNIRQRDGSNSGRRIIEDERRVLYQEFLKYVKYFKPKIFIMENVLGIRSAAGGHFFNCVQAEARVLGYRVHGEVIKAWEYGIPQKRERQLIIGTSLDLPIFSCNIYMPPTHSIEPNINKMNIVTLWEAIGDLPQVNSGHGEEIQTYDMHLREKHLSKYGGRYTVDVIEILKSKQLTAHRARHHSNRDLRDFKLLNEGETSANLIERGVKMESPYNNKTFKDRYTKQHRDNLCSTIVAHLSKDGLMFIHPTQNRSLTPREASRVQSFPDWFSFPVARTYQFQLIGNAVPPLLGKAVGSAVMKWFKTVGKYLNNDHTISKNINEKNAIAWLLEIVDIGNNGKLRKLPLESFKRGWFAVSYLYNHLHPDSAMENGTVEINDEIIKFPSLFNINPMLIKPIYQRSGWPVLIAPIATEARRRFKNGELTHKDYYCSEIQIAGYNNYLKKECHNAKN